MRIKKDGSVFRIELSSRTSEFETRVSFAVNDHQGMARPRVEVSQQKLAELFVEMLPHITMDLLTPKDDDPRLVEHLMRIAVEVAMHYHSNFSWAIPSKARSQIEALVAPPQTNVPIEERTDWRLMTKEVSALIDRLQEKPQEMKCTHYLSPISILLAYRQGDLNLEDAERELNRWHKNNL